MKDFSSLSGSAEAVVRALRERCETVALAESCTGGLVAKTLTDVAGSSNVFECGIVAYSETVKKQLLGVSAKTLAEHSVVSAEVALEMARGVRALAGSDYGIGITGVAGPGPDGNHPEGEIYIALAGAGFEKAVLLTDRSENARQMHRVSAAHVALQLLDTHFDLHRKEDCNNR